MKLSGRFTLVAAAAGAVGLSVLAPAAVASGSGPASPVHPSAAQKVVSLYANEPTYSSAAGKRQGTVDQVRPITGERTTLPVLKTVTRGTATWYQVRLPGRPNSHTGWIQSSHTKTWQISWHIVVDTGPQNNGAFNNHRRIYVYNHGKLVRSWLAVTGAPGRVTPHGQFFVEENINEGRGAIGGPYALATSARSNTFTEFDGGPGQVAIHGMDGGLQAKPGTAVSHGCIRLLDKEVTWLSARIYPGTPVTIVG